MSGIANSSVSSGAAVQQGAPQNGNGSQGSKVCDRPGCTGHGFYEEKRSWKTWFWAQDHLPTYNAQKNGVTKTEKPAPVDLMATDVPLRAGMSVTLGGRDVGAEADKMMEQMFDTTQTSLGAASFLPGIGDAIDLLNAGISYLRGNYGDVTTYAAASWIPFVAGAVIKKGTDALADANQVAQAVSDTFAQLRNLLHAVKNGMVGKNARVAKYFKDFHWKNLTPSEIPHVHFANTGEHNIALNMDGTWKHKPPQDWLMPQQARKYLESFGISIEPW